MFSYDNTQRYLIHNHFVYFFLWFQNAVHYFLLLLDLSRSTQQPFTFYKRVYGDPSNWPEVSLSSVRCSGVLPFLQCWAAARYSWQYNTVMMSRPHWCIMLTLGPAHTHWHCPVVCLSPWDLNVDQSPVNHSSQLGPSWKELCTNNPQENEVRTLTGTLLTHFTCNCFILSSPPLCLFLSLSSPSLSLPPPSLSVCDWVLSSLWPGCLGCHLEVIKTQGMAALLVAGLPLTVLLAEAELTPDWLQLVYNL